MREALERGWPAALLAALALGLSAANWLTLPGSAGAAAAVAGAAATIRLPAHVRLVLASGALAAAGLWWGGLRLHELDRSILASRIGQPAGVKVVVTGAAARSPFAVRVVGEVRRFDGVDLRERVLLELPAGRAPPQGAVLELRARPVAPRGPETGFDERGWLARRGIHVVLHASGSWQIVGRRGGIGGVGDRLRTEIAKALALGTDGERRSLVAGVVLGADEGIDPELRNAFKASGLYHLLAVSGQNIVLIGFGVLGLSYVAGLGRAIGHSLAIGAILAYALAVGWQPSVVRAAVAGCLASVAWLLARPSDRWHTMAVGAVVLLAWTPRSLLEPGFQLSFAAVAAIFLMLPRLRRLQEGYPVPLGIVEVVGISAACGVVTAPILWLQFGVIPLWTVPANALAEPAMPVLLGCGLGAALLAPVVPPAAVALSWLAGVGGCVDRVLGSPDLVAPLRADLVAEPRPRRSPAPASLRSASEHCLAIDVRLPSSPRLHSYHSERSAGGRFTHLRRGHLHRGYASRSSMSDRGTAFSSRHLRARCSWMQGHPRLGSIASSDGGGCTLSLHS